MLGEMDAKETAMDWNHYYEAVEPIFYLERKGHSESNTYIGASRVLDAIYEGHQAREGDQFHLLVGGDFLVRNGKPIADVSFWFPKHIFEKSYGSRNTSQGLFATLEKQGAVKRIPYPGIDLAYAKARHQEKEFPPNEPRLRYVENSPTAILLTSYGKTLATIARDNDMKVTFQDFHEERRAKLRVTRPEANGHRTVLEVVAPEDGRVYVNSPNETFDISGLIDLARKHPDTDPARIYDNGFWANGLNILEDEEFLDGIQAYFELAGGVSIPKR